MTFLYVKETLMFYTNIFTQEGTVKGMGLPLDLNGCDMHSVGISLKKGPVLSFGLLFNNRYPVEQYA